MSVIKHSPQRYGKTLMMHQMIDAMMKEDPNLKVLIKDHVNGDREYKTVQQVKQKKLEAPNADPKDGI